jgi:hypothetical protein
LTGLALIYTGRVVSGVMPVFVPERIPKEVSGWITGLFQITVVVG